MHDAGVRLELKGTSRCGVVRDRAIDFRILEIDSNAKVGIKPHDSVAAVARA
jgi:hypothetical protein